MRLEGKHRHLVALALASALLAGCIHVPAERSEPPPPVTSVPRPPDPALDLLEYARTLTQASPDTRVQRVLQARQAVENAPGAWSYARLALAYGTPHQRRYTPDEAARYAQLALDASDARWSPAARTYLHDYARLYGALSKPADPPEATSTRRAPLPDRLNDQHRRIIKLQDKLDEAHRKLRELADIENRLSTGNP